VLQSDNGSPIVRKGVEVIFEPAERISGPFFSQWLTQEPEGKDLIRRSKSGNSCLPASREFWAEIQSLQPAEAIKILRSKGRRSKQQAQLPRAFSGPGHSVVGITNSDCTCPALPDFSFPPRNACNPPRRGQASMPGVPVGGSLSEPSLERSSRMPP
jgi:hypothetical protein